MKTLFSILTLSFFVLGLNAQELKTKNGFTILPESGDYGIGIDATPIFNFFGNFVKINQAAAFNDPSAWNFLDANNYIFGKYFMDEQTAIRGKLRIGITTTTDKELVMQDGQSDPSVTVEDKITSGRRNIVLGAGMEKRRGKTRLQGFYGGEVMILLGGGKDKFTYGNTIQNGNATFYDFIDIDGDNFDGVENLNNTGARPLENKIGGVFGFGVRAFIGAEYFILPKISVGGEFGWGLNMLSQGNGELKLETWDAANNSIKTLTIKTAGGSSFGFDTDNFGGCIYMMIHF